MYIFFAVVITLLGGVGYNIWIRNRQLNTSLLGMTKELESAKQDNQNLQITISKLQVEKKCLQDDVQRVTNQYDIMFTRFKDMAITVLEEKTQKFTELNHKNLQTILQPLSDHIAMFEKQLESNNRVHNDQSTALRIEIGKLYTLNNKITQEAENLTNAIKGNNKIQGNWGELILEKILENSGLKRDREYIVQPSFVTDEGKMRQPDVVINLPQERHIIIDSKVSLNNYEQYYNATDDDIQKDQLKKHLLSIRKHVSELSVKNYQEQYSVNGLDFVIMFIPIEQAYTLIVQNDHTVFSDAYEKNIILVSPSTLIATLRTVSNVWKNEHQNQNALEIAQLSGALYDKFVGFIDDLKQIGKQLNNTQESYTEAVKKLYQGRGNLVTRAEKIKTLGAKTTKTLDPKLVKYSEYT